MSFEDIIDRVKTHPEIWQREHPLYKNKVLRQRLWKKMSKELGTDAIQLKKSWKYLTDQYRRELKKMNNIAPYAGEPVPCGWAYYDPLSFLQEEMETRRDRRAARVPIDSDSDTNANYANAKDSQPKPPQPFSESFQQDDDSSENTTWKFNSKRKIPKPSSVSGEVTKADLILRRLECLCASTSNKQSEELQKDEDHMFFMSILPMVRTLSPVRKLQLRGKINEWLLQALSETDPLNNAGLYMMRVEVDSKEAVMKDIMVTEDDS